MDNLNASLGERETARQQSQAETDELDGRLARSRNELNALELQRQGIGDILMGEVDGKRPDGFDYGNSPHEIFQADVMGKSIVQSTRAGTVGVAAATQAAAIYLGSFAVAQATVDGVVALEVETGLAADELGAGERDDAGAHAGRARGAQATT